MANLALRTAELDYRPPQSGRPISSPAPPISSTRPISSRPENIIMPNPCDQQLFDACRLGSLDKAKSAFADGADPEAMHQKSKSTPLTYVRMQRIRAFDAEKGAEQDSSIYGRNSSPAFAPPSDYTKVENLILDKILLKAAGCGDVGKMEWALDEGASKEAMDPDFEASAVVVAASAGHFDAVRMLRDRGADMDKRDIYGMNVWEWISINKPRESNDI